MKFVFPTYFVLLGSFSSTSIRDEVLLAPSLISNAFFLFYFCFFHTHTLSLILSDSLAFEDSSLRGRRPSKRNDAHEPTRIRGGRVVHSLALQYLLI